ncbi:hypothetical protein EZ428_05235 [Pedobacter frigiditerrae]|uniref:ATP-binding protein n=1 Tax=Pedobacter frigiditerrae TaxID=2530452 RepID=A0A4R0N487_9SPHI|nr:hypothetical protein [Pedobacter frigiditerrae]TCC94183.1 hypothetical protein EZ428_05235 [Pedobacter frigiditerrae]
MDNHITEFRPGKRIGANLSILTLQEKKLVDILTKYDWFLTRVDEIFIANSAYKAMLMKPSPKIKQAFNISREVVFAFSPYDTFQPRSIDSIEHYDIQELRLEEICSVIISKDNDIEQKLNSILKTNEEARVIVPFSYHELEESANDPDYFINKFRQNFYSRDLFGIQDPLKKDLYFFGRRDLIHTLVNKHLSSENAGIFGLRKTGKTSILYGIERALDRKNSTTVFVDCQTLHLKKWNTALLYIIDELRKSSSVKNEDLKLIKGYEKLEFVSDFFLDDIKTIYHKNGKKSILLIFDEIEHITFESSISSDWKNGDSYIKFWQIIRSTYQKLRQINVMTYLITGTNPKCIEQSAVNKIDNPIFAQFQPIYIPPFDFNQTKEMLDKLGGYMGLKFDEITCARLVEDFGGHPLLMRQMCSFIHRKTVKPRPHHIHKSEYENLKKLFYEDESGFIKYAQMVLEVLDNWYPDEAQMLTWLSIGDNETFKGLADASPDYIKHLINYGIIEKNDENYSFSIESLKDYLSRKNKYKRLRLTNEEKQNEISVRRNTIEPILRKYVRNTLKANYGEVEAKKLIIKEIYGAKEISKHENKPYAEFYDSNKHNIYLKTLFDLMKKHWEKCFRNTFEIDEKVFEAKATFINHLRKGDAHASKITDQDFQSFRGAMEWLEERLHEFN